MSFSGSVWAQLKNITAAELIRALERDGWQLRKSRGSSRIYRKEHRMVAIHYHVGKTFDATGKAGSLTLSQPSPSNIGF